MGTVDPETLSIFLKVVVLFNYIRILRKLGEDSKTLYSIVGGTSTKII